MADKEQRPGEKTPLAQAFFDGVLEGLAKRGIAFERGAAKPLYSPRRLAVVLPAMAGIHALIGIGEGLITWAALSLVLVTRADLLQLQKV